MNRKYIVFTLTIFLSILAFSFSGNAQIRDTAKCKVLFIDKQPVFDGDLDEFIQNKIQYPDSAKINGVEGKVYISLWIEKTGKTSYHKILKSVDKSLDKEALRVTKLITFKEPAIKKGKPKKIRYIVSVDFKL